MRCLLESGDVRCGSCRRPVRLTRSQSAQLRSRRLAQRREDWNEIPWGEDADDGDASMMSPALLVRIPTDEVYEVFTTQSRAAAQAQFMQAMQIADEVKQEFDAYEFEEGALEAAVMAAVSALLGEYSPDPH